VIAALAPTAGRQALGPRDREALLHLARQAIGEHLGSGRRRSGVPLEPALLAPAGAFVTVEVRGALRGCMGRIEPDGPLYQVVSELATAASSRDPRFPPILPEELADTRITISVLSPLEPATAETIVIGRDGLVITRDGQRGLLLPQVASEHGFGSERFLEETCHKAGLPRDAWRDPHTKVERFSAEVFSDA
jgi:AmmeMemoRadiSam system protein A